MSAIVAPLSITAILASITTILAPITTILSSIIAVVAIAVVAPVVTPWLRRRRRHLALRPHVVRVISQLPSKDIAQPENGRSGFA